MTLDEQIKLALAALPKERKRFIVVPKRPKAKGGKRRHAVTAPWHSREWVKQKLEAEGIRTMADLDKWIYGHVFVYDSGPLKGEKYLESRYGALKRILDEEAATWMLNDLAINQFVDDPRRGGKRPKAKGGGKKRHSGSKAASWKKGGKGEWYLGDLQRGAAASIVLMGPDSYSVDSLWSGVLTCHVDLYGVTLKSAKMKGAYLRRNTEMAFGGEEF